MTTKNYGPAVSGYLDPDGRAFENLVHQAGKPVLDKELNLGADLNQVAAQMVLRRAIPSGWISNDFTDRMSSLSGLFQATIDLNTLAMPSMLAHVNGWLIPVVHTNANGSNKISLGVGPSGAGSKRTDLVVLEVWRRLLSASTTTGKSPSGRIFLNGNVKVLGVDDPILNLTDDLLDGVVGSETTKRVQIQYRLRVIQNVDLFAYPAGIDDPTVAANSVPPNATTPDGTPTAFLYTNQSGAGDSGLWRAGDGNPANTLGTVDGYMYAIPVAAVFRRNTSPFNRNSNHNGGVTSPGPSDRPDGLFYDIIDLRDVADLRRGVAPSGWDSAEIVEKNVNSLLDNALQTEWMQVTIGGGQNGHTVLTADEIGVSNSNGGDGVVNGDTPGANFIGQFDYTRRRFSDRVTYEIMTVKVTPGTPAVSTATWQTGTVVTLQPSALAPYPHASFNFPAYAPSQTRLIDVLRARIMGSGAAEKSKQVGLKVDASLSTTAIPWDTITGLGNFPMTDVVLTLGTVPGGSVTTEPMYIDLLVAYPSGQGLTSTPTASYAGSFTINNPAQLPVSAPTSFSTTIGLAIDQPHREANLEYKTLPITFSFRADDGATDTYLMPEKVDTIVQVQKNGSPVVGNVDVATGRILTLAANTAAGDLIDVSYNARRPIPQTGVQFTIYYESRAPQTIRGSLLPNSLPLAPKYISSYLYSLTAGPASSGEGYPFPFAYVQSGGVKPGLGSFAGDHELDGAVLIQVANFGASTGLLRLPVFLPYVPDPQAVTFTRGPGDVDMEGRSFYPSVPAGYLPNAYAQPLSDNRLHKVMLPTIMETMADSQVGRKGTLLLVLLTRWVTNDPENSIRFDLTASNTTSASIYRLNGNLLNRRV